MCIKRGIGVLFVSVSGMDINDRRLDCLTGSWGEGREGWVNGVGGRSMMKKQKTKAR